MDLREALYALETATRNIIGEPFFDGLIAQAAFWAGKALCAYGAGEHGPALWFASAGARLWLCLCQPLHQLIRSRMLFVRFNLAGLFNEGARLLGVVLTYPPVLGLRHLLFQSSVQIQRHALISLVALLRRKRQLSQTNNIDFCSSSRAVQRRFGMASPNGLKLAPPLGPFLLNGRWPV